MNRRADKKLVRAARARMSKTGESFTAALAHVRCAWKRADAAAAPGERAAADAAAWLAETTPVGRCAAAVEAARASATPGPVQALVEAGALAAPTSPTATEMLRTAARTHRAAAPFLRADDLAGAEQVYSAAGLDPATLHAMREVTSGIAASVAPVLREIQRIEESYGPALRETRRVEAQIEAAVGPTLRAIRRVEEDLAPHFARVQEMQAALRVAPEPAWVASMRQQLAAFEASPLATAMRDAAATIERVLGPDGARRLAAQRARNATRHTE